MYFKLVNTMGFHSAWLFMDSHVQEGLKMTYV